MRILFPTLAAFPSSDAPVVQVAHMAQAFARLGHDVTLVAPVAGSGAVEDVLGEAPAFATTVLARREHRGMSYVNAVRLAALARRLRPDLVFSRDLRGCLLPALRGVPTVLEAHTLSSLTGVQDRLALRTLTRAAGFRAIVAISAALSEDLTAELGVDPQHILVAHDAVSDPGEAARARGPRDPAEPLHVVYTGSLFPGKGADLLLDVAARCPWARVTIAGGPPERARTLRTRADERGLGNVVILGPVPPVEARRLQAAADVLVAPFARRIESDSGHDIARWTSPMKLFEYMATGRPIVVSDLPVLREVLRPDVDALMVPPEDVAALVAALVRLRDEPGLAERLAASALSRVRAAHTWDIRARRILERVCA
jgi:glycosyltransferase involved in cell wall biosynthesis